jgi:hypothetical protein
MSPLVQVIRGEPDDAELAALVVVITLLRYTNVDCPPDGKPATVSWEHAGPSYRPPGMWSSS